ncbi:GLPGLI family protein [uncultured Flavobacterium sp.]|uniref:GLPGLI family protein n=1 Tax=uncultured Flavobacterium sp. TaxID=165435 RepID=UPI0030ECFC94
MMKQIIFLIFITLNSFSQDKLVVYNFKLLEDKKFMENKTLGDLYKKGIEQAKHIKLNLEFNDTIARFKMQETMSAEENNRNMAVAFCNCKEDIYIYNYKVYRSNTEGLFKKNEFLIIDSLNMNWKFLNESKLIDGYECYKATNEYIVINSKGELRHPVVAWYCPQLPYSFGPVGYGGLPGLILELQVRNNVFGVEKIILDHKIEEPIKLPTKGEVITDEDYNNKIKKIMEDRFENKE